MTAARIILSATLLALTMGCATRVSSVRAPPLPAQARVDPSHYVVVTVRNEQRIHAVRPGSTPRGYDSAVAYGVTADANTTVHALERDYGLNAVSAWPIATLSIHCVVFRMPLAASRPGMVAQLTRDPRVESVQALNEFAAEAQPSDAQVASFPSESGASQSPPQEISPVATVSDDRRPRSEISWGPRATFDNRTTSDAQVASFPSESGASQATFDNRTTSDAKVASFASGSKAPQATFDNRTKYNDPYASLQLTLDELGIPEAQQRSSGAGVRIAVIDTGMDFDHPDLEQRVMGRRDFVGGDEQAFRRDRHGTQVAGVMAAAANNGIGIVGIAPAARLLALKACWQVRGDSGHALCNSFTLAQAVEAAIVARVDVVNLSLAGPADPLLTRLVRFGMQQGIIFVGAVAPRGVVGGFPAGIDGVLAVEAAEDSSGDPRYLRAPGRDVLTLVPEAHYDYASGSSLAAAEVSGIVALMLGRSPHLSSAVANSILLHSSKRVETAAGTLICVNARSALDDAATSGSARRRVAGN